MSKTKHKFNFRHEDRNYRDGEEITLAKLRSEKSKRRIKRLQHAIRTRNLDKLLDYDDEYNY